MPLFWNNLGRDRQRRRCDCPECRSRRAIIRFIDWLDSPAGPWSTAMLLAVMIGLAVAYWRLSPAATAILG